MDSIKLKIERVTFVNSDNGYVVLKGLTKNYRETTAVGFLSDAISTVNLVGTEYEFYGTWETSKYGHQFIFQRARLVTNQLFYFLAKIVKGLGEKLSRELINHYGEKTLIEILEHTPEKLTEFKGIKEKKIIKIKQSWEKQKNVRALSEYLLPYGITPNLLIRIHNYFGENALSKIKENPYSLVDIRGIGFKTADEIAVKLGTEFNSIFRIQSAINHVLLEEGENKGHTYLPMQMLYEQLEELLNIDPQKISMQVVHKAIENMYDLGNIYAERDNNGIKKIALAAYKYMEDEIYSFFKNRSNNALYDPISTNVDVENFICEEEKKQQLKFSVEQKEIIKLIGTNKSRVYALSGYAGTGKSTISKAILEFLGKNFCDKADIACCAFTGMAAVRIRKLTNYPSSTIHTLLRYKGNNQFEYGNENKLPQKVILLDEASMVNLNLFYRLIQAVGEDTLFIMVGDHAQLPPIGSGNVFDDVIKKEMFPRVSLTTIYRQDEKSVLVHFANIIRTGEVPQQYKCEYRDFTFISQDIPYYFKLKEKLPEEKIKQLKDENNEKIRDKILEFAMRSLKNLKNPYWDFQVLSPMKRGILGTENMNICLQEIFNKNETDLVCKFGVNFKKRDKVVHLKNKDMEVTNYFPGVLKKEDIPYFKQRIFNGNVGMIMGIDHENENFFVLYPGNILVKYNFDHIKDLIDLAYCLTVHKAQGSEYKVVAIPMSNSHFIMLNNKWFYTALTRAEKKVFLVGQEYAFERACTNTSSLERFTFLAL